MPKSNDPSRSLSTQPYRTTMAAQTVARTIRVYDVDGRTAILRPLADVLSPKTRAMLAAIEQNGGRHGRR